MSTRTSKVATKKTNKTSVKKSHKKSELTSRTKNDSFDDITNDVIRFDFDKEVDDLTIDLGQGTLSF